MNGRMCGYSFTEMAFSQPIQTFVLRGTGEDTHGCRLWRGCVTSFTFVFLKIGFLHQSEFDKVICITALGPGRKTNFG